MSKKALVVFCVAFVAVVVYFLSLEAAIVALWSTMALLTGLFVSGYVAFYGIKVRRLRLGTDTFPDLDALVMHRRLIDMMIFFILVGVTGIEITVRKVGGLWGDPWFVAFHLSLVACMTTTLVLARTKHTGLKNPALHRKLVYPFILSFMATFTTGFLLLEEKFPISDVERAVFRAQAGLK